MELIGIIIIVFLQLVTLMKMHFDHKDMYLQLNKDHKAIFDTIKKVVKEIKQQIKGKK